MMVNPDVDGYTKTLNHRKIIRKTPKNNVPKNKKILNTEMQAKRWSLFQN